MPHVPSGLLCHVTSADILHKIRMSPKPVGYETHASSQSIPSGVRAIEQVEGAIEKLAFRFNQVRTYVCMYVIQTKKGQPSLPQVAINFVQHLF